MKTITTIHTEIGYTNNIEIVERALREQFLIDDQTYNLRAVAAHIWSLICTRDDGNNGKQWGTVEITDAINGCLFRLQEMAKAIAKYSKCRECGDDLKDSSDLVCFTCRELENNRRYRHYHQIGEYKPETMERL